jgi:hypothetical protein
MVVSVFAEALCQLSNADLLVDDQLTDQLHGWISLFQSNMDVFRSGSQPTPLETFAMLLHQLKLHLLTIECYHNRYLPESCKDMMDFIYNHLIHCLNGFIANEQLVNPMLSWRFKLVMDNSYLTFANIFLLWICRNAQLTQWQLESYVTMEVFIKRYGLSMNIPNMDEYVMPLQARLTPLLLVDNVTSITAVFAEAIERSGESLMAPLFAAKLNDQNNEFFKSLLLMSDRVIIDDECKQLAIRQKEEWEAIVALAMEQITNAL